MCLFPAALGVYYYEYKFSVYEITTKLFNLIKIKKFFNKNKKNRIF